MIKLLDGPAEGGYTVRRAPLYLRAVVDSAGKRDVLNLLEDTPGDSESIYVYRRITESWPVHLNLGRRAGTGFYVTGDYQHVAYIDGGKYRDNDAWREWVISQVPAKADPETGEIS